MKVVIPAKAGIQLLLYAVLLAPAVALAKPIAFQDGTTLMFEAGGFMQEAQVFYAPRYWWSLGGGYLKLEDEDETFSREIGYARVNFLVKRWNLPAAQANIFAWGGAGSARGSDFEGRETATNAGFQMDAESLRYYSSFKSDFQHASGKFAHRIDTLQLGFAPYKHDYTRLATWILVQGRYYTGDLYDGVEGALLLRFFKGPLWVEAGVTADGEPQAMMMINY